MLIAGIIFAYLVLGLATLKALACWRTASYVDPVVAFVCVLFWPFEAAVLALIGAGQLFLWLVRE